MGDDEDRDGLTDLYLRHVIPLPQRDLPSSRWGRRMEKSRARQSSASAHRYRTLSCNVTDAAVLKESMKFFHLLNLM